MTWASPRTAPSSSATRSISLWSASARRSAGSERSSAQPKKLGTMAVCSSSISRHRAWSASRSSVEAARIRHATSGTAERLGQHGLHVAAVDGLAQKIVGAERARMLFRGLARLGGHHADARLGQVGVLAHALDQLHTVEDRHVEIDEHEVVALLRQELQR